MKIGIIIQARMKSTRLPGKVLLPMPLWGDRPMIHGIVDQARMSIHGGQSVIVATSDSPSDLAVSTYCESHSIKCYRGSENDVLSRFVDVIKLYDLDVVVRLTGDNPIIDVEILDQLIENHVERKSVYSHTLGLPLGMNFEVISSEALLALYETGHYTEADAEHVTPSFRRDGSNLEEVFTIRGFENISGIRLTVDYPVDYLLASAVNAWMEKHKIRGARGVQAMWTEHAWLFESNASNYQKRVYQNLHEEVRAAISVLEKNDMFGAAKALSDLYP